MPAPTLGMPGAALECVGFAFELPDPERGRVVAALRTREGKSFVPTTNRRVHGYYADVRDHRAEPLLQGNTIPGFGDFHT